MDKFNYTTVDGLFAQNRVKEFLLPALHLSLVQLRKGRACRNSRALRVVWVQAVAKCMSDILS